MKAKLYVVSGPSGAGKGTICRELLARRPEICLSVSCATRAPRAGEVDGEHYYFVTEAEFLRLRDAGGLLECAQINGGYWYGTPRAQVESRLAQGQSVLLEIENNGARQVMDRYPETVSVFILPPDGETLIRRLVGRGTEDLPRLARRIEKIPSELEAAKDYRYLVLNDQVPLAVNRLEAIFDGAYRENPEDRERLRGLAREFADTERALARMRECYRALREKEG